MEEASLGLLACVPELKDMRSDLTLSGGLAGQELYLPKPKLLRMLRKSQPSFSSIFMRLKMAKAQPNMIGLLLILISLSITVLTAAGAFHGPCVVAITASARTIV